MTQNYYTVLGVAPGATTDEVLAAYDERLQGALNDPAHTATLEEAVDVLTHPQKRRVYDQQHGLPTPQEKRAVSGREALYGIVGVLVGLLVLSGVWLATGRSQQTALPQVTEVTPYDAPEFTLKNLDGQPVNLSDYRGKVVLLNFWGTFCEPCKAETPALEQAYQNLKDQGFVILGVDLYNAERNYNYDLEDVRRFAALYGVSYPLLLDDTGEVGSAYAIAPIPTSYVIDQQGKVRYVKVGPLNESDVERLFRSLQPNTG